MQLQDFTPIPTTQEYKTFAGITDKYKTCPFCNSKYEYTTARYETILKCPNHHFQCKLKRVHRKHNNITYSKYIATFSISLDGWSIYYSSNWHDVVFIERYSMPSLDFLSFVTNANRIKFKKPFISIDNWFNKTNLQTTLNKISILL